LAVGGVAALDYWRDVPAEVAPPPLDPASLTPGFGAATFAEAVAAADSNLEGKRYLLAREPDDWLRMEGVARALLARVRLTASAADLAEANRLLDTAIARAPWPSGPTLSRAGAALSIHDLGGVDKALARFDASVTPPPPVEAVDARGMRCEVAFERGDLAGAQRLCGRGGDLGLDLRRANLSLASGDPAEAARLVEAALRRPGQSPFQLSRIMLQRSAIALGAGDWEAAGEWARAADRAFPGYWLAEAFVAQSLALEGDTAGAEAAYRKIAQRTGDPDVYGALVVLAEARGDDAAMKRYLAGARKGWEARAALLPDTYAGHYAEHLALSGQLERALAMAGSDYRRRPYLQPMTDYVFVLDAANRPDQIVEVVETGERRGFRSATLLLAKADALAALGRTGEAAEARRGALAINPRVEHPRQAFVHFRQD
jgi:tetratricopeptide (TPR) repeat protein